MYRLKFRFAVILAGCLLFAMTGMAVAQTKRKSARKPASTAPAPTTSDDYRIISTADDPDAQSTSGSRRSRRTNAGDPPDSTSVSGLARQVTTLNQRIAQMEANQKALVDMERLTRAEQRADALHTQLYAAQDRESYLQSRIDGIDIDLQPENIENGNAMNGSTHPELMRDQRKKYLEAERVKAVAQLSQTTTNRARLESAVAGADALVDRLRRVVEADDQTTMANQAGALPADNAAPDTSNTPAAPAPANDDQYTEPENVPSDAELVRSIKASLADAGITTVTVEAANGAVILTGDIQSAQVPAALRAATDAHPRKIYNQMSVK
jgi:hypothetical protein